jgi:hypothetical protein
MARARKPTEDDKKLEIDTSLFGFEDEEGWKVGWYEGNNPYRQSPYPPSELEAISIPSLFTPDVRTELAREFNFTEAQVAELARRVEASLDPDLNPLTLAVAHSDGARRGTAAVERGFVALSDAQERITDALTALVPLRAIAPSVDAGQSLSSVVQAIEQCQSNALKATTILDEKLRHKGVLYDPVVADKRQVGAARRTVVLFAVFNFWIWAGRRVTFSTASDPAVKDGRRRFGLLIDLCFFVVRLARQDGRQVSDQTIVEAIKEWKSTKSLTPDSSF